MAGWYGPLVDLAEARDHVGAHVQLVVLVLQRHPPELLVTKKGQARKSLVLVGDRTRLYFKIHLWHSLAASELSAGDIVFFKNVNLRSFKNVVEASASQHSSVTVLVQCAQLLTMPEEDGAVADYQDCTTVHVKLKGVVQWARESQMALLYFLTNLHSNKIPTQHCSTFSPITAGNEVHIKKCTSVKQAIASTDSSHVDFVANIGEICVPEDAGCRFLYASKCLSSNKATEIIRSVLCIGCKRCGSPLNCDENRVYERCNCGVSRLCKQHESTSRQAACIYRPFLIHVWDQSAQVTVHVRHTAAVQLFAGVEADDVLKSLQHRVTSDISIDSASILQHELGSQISSSALREEGRVKFDNLLIVLLKALVSRDKNTMFKFQVYCGPQNSGGYMDRSYDLVSFQMPII